MQVPAILRSKRVVSGAVAAFAFVALTATGVISAQQADQQIDFNNLDAFNLHGFEFAQSAGSDGGFTMSASPQDQQFFTQQQGDFFTQGQGGQSFSQGNQDQQQFFTTNSQDAQVFFQQGGQEQQQFFAQQQGQQQLFSTQGDPQAFFQQMQQGQFQFQGVDPAVFYASCTQAAIRVREQTRIRLFQNYYGLQLQLMRWRAQRLEQIWSITDANARRDAENAMESQFRDAQRSLSQQLNQNERGISERYRQHQQQCHDTRRELERQQRQRSSSSSSRSSAMSTSRSSSPSSTSTSRSSSRSSAMSGFNSSAGFQHSAGFSFGFNSAAFSFGCVHNCGGFNFSSGNFGGGGGGFFNGGFQGNVTGTTFGPFIFARTLPELLRQIPPGTCMQVFAIPGNGQTRVFCN